MSELLKRKHMLCILVGLVVVAGILAYMSWDVKSQETGSCGCATPSQDEGYISPSLRSMAERNKESLYKPKEKLINYAKPPERFVPLPGGNSMMNQMNQMRGAPVAKSMNSMASPFINYGQ